MHIITNKVIFGKDIIMVTSAESAQATPEQINAQLSQQIRLVDSLSARGLSTHSERRTALGLQDTYGDLKGWNEDNKDEYYFNLSVRLNQKPTAAAYSGWMKHYARQARAAYEAGATPLYKEALDNTKAVLLTAATERNWSQEKIDERLVRMSAYIEGRTPPPDQPEATQRKTLGALLGGTALAGIIARRKRTPETSKRRRALIVGGVVVGAMAAAAIVDGILISRGHGFTLRDLGLQFGGQPAANPANHLPPSTQSGTSLQPKEPKAAPPRSSGRIAHEQLRYHGDTIYYHVKHLLGKSATEGQVNQEVSKVLKLNHTTYEQARHLPVGFKFIMHVSR